MPIKSLEGYIRREIDWARRPPKKFSVIDIRGDTEEYRISCIMHGDESPINESTEDYMKMLSVKPEDGEIYYILEDIYSRVHSYITSLSDSCFSIYLKTITTDPKHPCHKEEPFRGSYEFCSISRVNFEKDIVNNDNIYNSIVNFFRGVDNSIQESDMTPVVFGFSSSSPCSISTLNCRVETLYPHKFYKGVDSREEFNSVSGKSGHGKTTINIKESSIGHLESVQYLDVIEDYMLDEMYTFHSPHVEFLFNPDEIRIEESSVKGSFLLYFPFEWSWNKAGEPLNSRQESLDLNTYEHNRR